MGDAHISIQELKSDQESNDYYQKSDFNQRRELSKAELDHNKMSANVMNKKPITAFASPIKRRTLKSRGKWGQNFSTNISLRLKMH